MDLLFYVTFYFYKHQPNHIDAANASGLNFIC